MLKNLFVLLSLFTLPLGLSHSTTASPSRPETVLEQAVLPRYGMHTLVADERTLPLVRATGFDTVVQLLARWEIEPTQDQFIWQAADEAVAGADYYGLNLVIRLDKPPA